MNIHEMTKFFDRGEVFHFARYDKSVWKFLLKKVFLPDEEELHHNVLQTIREQKHYLYGIADEAFDELRDPIAKLLEGTFIPWISADMFKYATDPDLLNFANKLPKTRCIISHTGASYYNTVHTKSVERRIELDAFIEVVYETAADFDAVLFCMDSFFPLIAIHRLHEKFRRDTWFIDIGILT